MKGFTMIELMIALFIVIITVALAVSVYTPYVTKSRRSDGINSILTMQLAEERYRSNNASYGTLAQIGTGSSSPLGYYTLSVTNVSATGYTLNATAQGNQANDVDGSTSCSTLVMTVSNATITKTPTECWPT